MNLLRNSCNHVKATSTVDLCENGSYSESYKTQSDRIVDVSCHGNNFYDIKDLMDTFQPPGLLAELQDYIEGFETLHLLEKRFRIHFKLQILPIVKDTVLITLYPVSFDESDDVIKSVVHSNAWGNCERVTRAVHTSHPEKKNGCVHVAISNIIRENIPESVVINGVTAFIAVQDKEPKKKVVEEEEEEDGCLEPKVVLSVGERVII